jgi:hypothetical protein
VVTVDVKRIRKGARNAVVAYGVLTAAVFTLSLLDVSAPASIFLGLQTVALFVKAKDLMGHNVGR